MRALGIKQGLDGRPIRVVLGSFDEKLFGNFLVGDDQKVRAQYLQPVKPAPAILICPFLQLQPCVLDRKIVYSAQVRYQCWPWTAAVVIQLLEDANQVVDASNDE
jgi:hypothetical protein